MLKLGLYNGSIHNLDGTRKAFVGSVNRNAFTVKYRDSVDPESNRWERCSEVLSRRDIIKKLSEPW